MNIKDKIYASGFKQWEVADAMGVSEFTLSRYLRRPDKINSARLIQIENALKSLKAEENKEVN